jgi:two-component system chemotaxis sensor kinase CheA
VPVVEEPVVEDIQEGFLPEDADPTLLSEFITECRELVEGAEAALLAMETDPDDLESINTVFRAFHTIKGTSGFLGISRMAELAHKAESLLSRMRDKEIRCTGGYADLALRSVDLLNELIQMVQDALGGDPLELPQGYGSLMRVLSDPEAAGVSQDSGGVVPVAQPLETGPGEAPPAVAVSDAGDGQTESAAEPDLAKTARSQQRAKLAEHTDDSSVRVRTDRLDKLIEMVGELVIAQAMVAQDQVVIAGMNHELVRKVGHAGKIVRELQDLSMSMRMVPLKATLQKMARLVRDIARKSGKEVEFVPSGEDTEIDRNMVDAIADPLVHMIRNAVDHGVESPEERVAAGKPRKGTVRLSAIHSGGNVVVKISDDGKGLSRERIVEKAISKGLIESDKAMSDGDVFNLIFAPGFSTVEKVTEFSGRGVGMDVVRKSIEALRGRVEISSELGSGTTFTLRLPLTLAITDGMLIRIGGERYIIPTINIQLSFRPDASAISTVAGRGELVLLRGDLMPVFRLHRLFNIADAVEDPTKGLLVVVGAEDRRCALLVDELLGQQQVVAKTLGDGIGKVPGVTGGAILGDGRVGLILDTAELIAIARQSASRR